MAIATAAKQVVHDGMDVAVGGGHDNISMVQNAYMDWVRREADPNVTAKAPHAYMPMLQTAEFVAKKYGVTREAQDRYALEISAAHGGGAERRAGSTPKSFPFATTMEVVDQVTGEKSFKEITLTKDEGNGLTPASEGLAGLKPVACEGNFVTAGNASQLSDGASACVMMKSRDWRRNAGCSPWRLSRHRGRRLRARRDGHRAGLRRAEAAEASRPEGRRYRALGAQRGVRGARLVYCRDRLGIVGQSTTSTAAPSRSAIPTA